MIEELMQHHNMRQLLEKEKKSIKLQLKEIDWLLQQEKKVLIFTDLQIRLDS
jgi:hypothetical protein